MYSKKVINLWNVCQYLYVKKKIYLVSNECKKKINIKKIRKNYFE